MPTLTRSGRAVLAGAAGLTLGGVLGGLAPAALAGSAALTGLALAWVAASPLPRQMRRQRVEFSWWIPAPKGAPGRARRPDEAVPVRVVLRNPSDGALELSMPRLALSQGLRYARAEGQRLRVPPRSAVSFEIEVRPAHPGRHVLHGVWLSLAGPLGLSWVPLYFPNPLVIEVEPRGFAASSTARAPRPPPSRARGGRSTRRAGEGPELKELRDHQPGDAFRRIAWGPSARRGKLLVRETEDEAQTTRVLVVDASATMRGDDRGHARIDHAVELTAQAARISLAAGDRLGLVGFDRRVVLEVAPSDEAAHLRALVGGAMELRSIVDEDLTEADDDALIETVARYFREQEGVDVGRGAQPWEARARLIDLARRAAGNDPAMRLPVRAKESGSRELRAFCRARAIPLPLRHDATGMAKAAGLAEALRASVRGAREARTVVVISDLDALAVTEAVRLALGALRQKRHRVSVVALSGRDFIGAAPRDLSAQAREAREALIDLFVSEEEARVSQMRRRLAALGVAVWSADAKQPMAHWLRRAAGSRAAAAAR